MSDYPNICDKQVQPVWVVITSPYATQKENNFTDRTSVGHRRGVTQDVIDDIKEMRKSGMSWGAIGNEKGMSRSLAYYWGNK